MKALGKHVVDRVIWWLYLAGMGLSAYGAFVAYVRDRPLYIWLGAMGWVASTAWGLFFRMYVMGDEGKGRRRKRNAVVSGRALWSRVRGRSAVR